MNEIGYSVAIFMAISEALLSKNNYSLGQLMKVRKAVAKSEWSKVEMQMSPIGGSLPISTFTSPIQNGRYVVAH